MCEVELKASYHFLAIPLVTSQTVAYSRRWIKVAQNIFETLSDAFSQSNSSNSKLPWSALVRGVCMEDWRGSGYAMCMQRSRKILGRTAIKWEHAPCIQINLQEQCDAQHCKGCLIVCRIFLHTTAYWLQYVSERIKPYLLDLLLCMPWPYNATEKNLTLQKSRSQFLQRDKLFQLRCFKVQIDAILAATCIESTRLT